MSSTIDRLFKEITTPSCEEVEAALLETLDEWAGTVDPSQLDPITRAHFDTCGECQQFVQEMSVLLDTSDQREAVSAAVESYLDQRIAERVRSATVYFSDLTALAMATRTASAELAGARSGTRDDAAARLSIQTITDDPDGRWRLRCSAFLEPPASADTPPTYWVELDLLKPGTKRRWKDAPWHLTARLDDREIGTISLPNEEGVLRLIEPMSEDDLSKIEFVVTLLD